MTQNLTPNKAGSEASARRTRLAPSPTGALHLGNARTFLATWLIARQSGWKVVLRIEDLDGPRVKKGADHQAIDDLVWLGLDWDEGPIYQSPRASRYRRAIEKLTVQRSAYPCVCSRREAILAASAPHADEHAVIYPGTCRDRFQSVAQARGLSGKEPALRFRVPDVTIRFDDTFRGPHTFEPARTLGDFVIAKADGTAAYQLAVVIDDAEMGVTDVIRGDDLLDSTPRQVLLYRALGLDGRIPSYTHLPLVVGTDGKRLAKRHGDTRLAHYRNSGVAASTILALLSEWLGIRIEEPGITGGAKSLLGKFDLKQVPTEPIVFDQSRALIPARPQRATR